MNTTIENPEWDQVLDASEQSICRQQIMPTSIHKPTIDDELKAQEKIAFGELKLRKNESAILGVDFGALYYKKFEKAKKICDPDGILQAYEIYFENKRICKFYRSKGGEFKDYHLKIIKNSFNTFKIKRMLHILGMLYAFENRNETV
jgi:hypothetical protein